MTKAFIKFKPVLPNSEAHNQREKKPSYLVTPETENLSFGEMSVKEKREQLQRLVKEKTGRKMQKKATPIREAVVLLENDDNNINGKVLRNLTNELEKQYGIKAFQWHIHNDEGYEDETGMIKYNYHAHIVFDWVDHETGKSFKLNKDDMSEMISLTSEALNMERGIKGSENLSFNHHQYKLYLQMKAELIKKLQVKKLSKEEEITLRREIKQSEIRMKS